jgi:hypothetical protein
MWYITVELCYVSVLRIGVHEPSGAEWSHQRATGPAFGKILISPTSRGHLTLVMTSCGSPRGARISGCLVHPWPISNGFSTVRGTHDFEFFSAL